MGIHRFRHIGWICGMTIDDFNPIHWGENML